jgi:AcrR family transcriptional regulator
MSKTLVDEAEARPNRRADVRERILAAAYELFSRQGTRNVGIDAIVESSGVAKMSLYRHFHSKEQLVAAFMNRREQQWTVEWLQSEAFQRATSASDRLLALFDIFNEWFHSPEFDGCSFINVLLEYPAGHAMRQTASAYLANIRSFVRDLAVQAGVRDPQTFADVWHMMMKGSIVAACEGNQESAREMKAAAQLFLDSSLAVHGTA